MQLPGMLATDLAQRVLSEYADTEEWKPYAKDKGAGSPVMAIPLSHPAVVRKSARRKILAQEVTEAVLKAFDLYHARHSRRDRGQNFLHIEKLVGLRLIRYEAGHFMVQHTDKYPDSDTGKTMWPAVTFSVNLNTGYEGGTLDLLDGAIRFKGGVGDGVFFPANFLYPHAIERVLSGARYSLVGWLL